MPVQAVDLGQVSSQVLHRRVGFLFRQEDRSEVVQLPDQSQNPQDISPSCPRCVRLRHGWTPADVGSSGSTSPEQLQLKGQWDGGTGDRDDSERCIQGTWERFRLRTHRQQTAPPWVSECPCGDRQRDMRTADPVSSETGSGPVLGFPPTWCPRCRCRCPLSWTPAAPSRTRTSPGRCRDNHSESHLSPPVNRCACFVSVT